MAKDAPTIVADADRIRAEAESIREETVTLIAEAGGRRPTRFQLVRWRRLQQRRKVLSRAADMALTRELALWMALRERLNRDPREDDQITAEDQRRASQIVSAFGLRTG
jgi:hypothetical protein